MSGRRKTREGISSKEEWASLQTCVDQFAGAFGYMPLVDSLLRWALFSDACAENVVFWHLCWKPKFFDTCAEKPNHQSFRLDPVLFKDPVSNLRKKYKALEGATWEESWKAIFMRSDHITRWSSGVYFRSRSWGEQLWALGEVQPKLFSQIWCWAKERRVLELLML